MRASLARIALSGLHGDDAPACDFIAESAEKGAEKGAEGAESMRTALGKRSSAGQSGFMLNFNVCRMQDGVSRMVNGL
jgi:hypothetical protein